MSDMEEFHADYGTQIDADEAERSEAMTDLTERIRVELAQWHGTSMSCGDCSSTSLVLLLREAMDEVERAGLAGWSAALEAAEAASEEE